MSSWYYLPIRHDAIANYLYEVIKKRKIQNASFEYKGDEFIDQYNGTEYWWNVAIKAAVKVRNNHPDLVIWEIKNKNCHVIQFG